MVKVFEICLEPPTGGKGYSSGCQVTGRVVVEVDEAKNYRQIDISFVGCGKVEWTKGSGEDSETYKAREEYSHETVTVWDSSREGHSGTLPAGHHEFPFTFSIPESCPSSYETERGSSNLDAWIRYTLTGQISTKGALKANHTTEKRVIVTKEPSLQPANAEPVRQRSQTVKGCLSCVSGPVDLTVEIPRSGFTVGEKIPLSVSLENGSGRSLRVEAALVKNVALKARGHGLKRPPQKVVSVSSNPYRAGSSVSWNPQTLIVPDGHATMETPGRMIKVSYEVRVHVGLRFGQKLEVSISVVIGHSDSPEHVVEKFSSTTTAVTVPTDDYQPWNS